MNITYWELILFAILFSLLVLLKTEALLSVIVLIILYIIYRYYTQQYARDNPDVVRSYVDKDISDNGYRFVERDNDFITMLRLLEFTKRYDQTKFSNLLEKLDAFVKTYVFLLADRWKIDLLMPDMYSLRLQILDILYSYYLVLPVRMRHVFGFRPLDRLREVIDLFDRRSKEMIGVVRLYAKHEKGIVHLEDYTVAPYNLKEDGALP